METTTLRASKIDLMSEGGSSKDRRKTKRQDGEFAAAIAAGVKKGLSESEKEKEKEKSRLLRIRHIGNVKRSGKQLRMFLQFA